MSSQRGNTVRTRPQKHKNRNAFKNDMYDKTPQTKMINTIQVSDVCVRCKEIIEWKIKYKKYKPLTQPKTCVKCGQKTVKKAYHVMCRECGAESKVCTKCCQSKEVIVASSTEKEQSMLDSEMKALLQSLPERKRRTFLRYIAKREKENETVTDNSKESKKKDLLDKLNYLKLEDNNEEDDFDSDIERGTGRIDE